MTAVVGVVEDAVGVAMPDEPLDPPEMLHFTGQELLTLYHVSQTLGVPISQVLQTASRMHVTLSGPWPAFIFLEGREFPIQFANQAALDFLGCEEADLVGQSMIELYAPEYRDRYDIASEFWNGGGIHGMRITVVKADGTAGRMILHAWRETDASGPPRVVAIWLPDEN